MNYRSKTSSQINQGRITHELEMEIWKGKSDDPYIQYVTFDGQHICEVSFRYSI